jgi:23S rRNA (cytosine1962-C5)-methyltransferase
LDPPAFAKTKDDIPDAMQAYRNLNTIVLEKMPPKSWLLTSSCSYHIDPTLFQKLIFQASDQAKRKVRIISRHRQAFDHPINIYHPEGEYLKSLLLFVE